jgi:hypothetical protein
MVESGFSTPTTASFSLNLSLTPRQSQAPSSFDLSEEPEGSTLPPSSPPPYLQSPASETVSDVEDEDQTFEGDGGSFPMDACTGQLIKWEAGSIWDTYAATPIHIMTMTKLAGCQLDMRGEIIYGFSRSLAMSFCIRMLN